MSDLSISNFLFNPIMDTDGYKPSHAYQYPEGIDGAFSYISARGISKEWKGALKDEVTWFGLQAIIEEVFTKPITSEMVDFAEKFYAAYGTSFDRSGFDYVVNECNGYMPITIQALPEGTKVHTSVMVARLWCVDKRFVKSMQHLETLLLRVWYPSTVATISNQSREYIRDAMEKTCDNLDGLDYKLHDFGSRGVSSPLSAAIGGAAHLAVGWKGSDTVLGVLGARLWYGEDMAAATIDASEHSTMTSWGLTLEGETAAYRNMIKAFGHKPIFACVSDANNIEFACREIWGGTLREEVLAMSAVLVIRPDSGDPCFWIPHLLEILADKFGFEINSKGYKVLNKVRIIWGDGITPFSLPRILVSIITAGFSIDNVAFGMGGGLLQKVDRDILKWAMKMSAIRINGVWKDVYKDPITDPGKASLKGLLTTDKPLDGVYTTERADNLEQLAYDAFVTFYHMEQGMDEPVGVRHDFDLIRELANEPMTTA